LEEPALRIRGAKRKAKERRHDPFQLLESIDSGMGGRPEDPSQRVTVGG
jgi:hypothetical protein